MSPSEAAAVTPPSSSVEAAPEQRVQRILKIIVVTLAILLFAGLAVAIARVIYLASAPVAQPSASAVTATATPAPMPAIRPEQSLAVPAGAQVRSVSLSGNRLAVHYEVGATSGIAVLDLQTGRMITNVAIEAKAVGR
jgi:hypothetical protein